MSRTYRNNDGEYCGRFDRVRKSFERGPENPGRDVKREFDDFVFDGDEDLELDEEELAAVEDAYEDDFDEEDD
jgi:hypothetical protein